MMTLKFASGLRNLLFIGAHCDDIEIGCGATILRLAEQCPAAQVTWVVFSSDPVRELETRTAASLLLTGFSKANVVVESFRNGYFPSISSELKDYFERLKREARPDAIFTHHRDDLHQDHRTLSELTWNTFRDHLIFEYEILKYDGDLSNPNTYFAVTEVAARRKVEVLTECFRSQHDKPWFTEDAFRSLMRIRGVHGASPTGLAEAFFVRKLLL